MKFIDDYKSIPFADPGDCTTIRKGLKHRIKVVRKFIGRDLATLHTLDIGAPNKFGLELGIKQNTYPTDLNRELYAPSANYDLILCSEIFEHFMNPYYVMERIYDLLKPGGVCILSTPLMQWHSGISFQSPHHFVEYRPERLRRFFVYMGFEVVKYKRYLLWDPSFMFWGVRPLLRVLFHRNQLWEIRKPE